MIPAVLQELMLQRAPGVNYVDLHSYAYLTMGVTSRKQHDKERCYSSEEACNFETAMMAIA